MYAALTVHTDSTISAGEAELQTFGRSLEVINCSAFKFSVNSLT